jgi:hypothetical protein
MGPGRFWVMFILRGLWMEVNWVKMGIVMRI